MTLPKRLSAAELVPGDVVWLDDDTWLIVGSDPAYKKRSSFLLINITRISSKTCKLISSPVSTLYWTTLIASEKADCE